MRLTVIASFLTITAAISGTAFATDGVKTSDPNKIVCRTEGVTGSRLGSRKRCMTVQEWSEIARLDRQAVERIQMTRFNGNESSGAPIQGDLGRSK